MFSLLAIFWSIYVVPSSVTAPIASSLLSGDLIFLLIIKSKSADNFLATTSAITTPPRGIPKTMMSCLLLCFCQ